MIALTGFTQWYLPSKFIARLFKINTSAIIFEFYNQWDNCFKIVKSDNALRSIIVALLIQIESVIDDTNTYICIENNIESIHNKRESADFTKICDLSP